jgi:sporulation protein YlmC with PRC-barrel domain
VIKIEQSSVIDIRDLIGIPVNDEKGLVMGKVVDFIINSRDGHLLAVCVKPSKHPDIEKFPKDEKGKILVPHSVIKSINDSIIISEEKIRVFTIKQKLQEGKSNTKSSYVDERTDEDI